MLCIHALLICMLLLPPVYLDKLRFKVSCKILFIFQPLKVGTTIFVPALAGHSVFLDDCNFHECANLESFDVDRSITLVRTGHLHQEVHICSALTSRTLSGM
jgi:hypothetical protein